MKHVASLIARDWAYAMKFSVESERVLSWFWVTGKGNILCACLLPLVEGMSFYPRALWLWLRSYWALLRPSYVVGEQTLTLLGRWIKVYFGKEASSTHSVWHHFSLINCSTSRASTWWGKLTYFLGFELCYSTSRGYWIKAGFSQQSFSRRQIVRWMGYQFWLGLVPYKVHLLLGSNAS